MSTTICDVVIVGFGPVGQALALMLGRQGRSVIVVERWPSRYPLPRAVCIDHEIYRVLSANGMGSDLPTISERGPVYKWFNAEWRELLSIDWSADSISGGPEVNFVHQPTLERTLQSAVWDLPSVNVKTGYAVTAIEQDARLAHVSARSEDGSDILGISAQYVVGCDGANSIVRKTIGSAQEDRGFEADWLVVDVLLRPGVTIESLGIPPSAQYCNPERPTTIVPAGVRDGGTYRRWEFMRLPGEDVADMEREERVWELLAPWADSEAVELVRHKVYTFRSLIAQTWRDGRLLLAGDAAHVMPPFMGQGMCSGLRDGWNLAWKLSLLLDGRADPALLETYQVERAPHVGQLIDMSIYLGKTICIPDREVAAERDRMFFEGRQPAMPPFPRLTDGFLARGGDGELVLGAGWLSPHSLVSRGREAGRLDDLLPGGFRVVTQGDNPRVLEIADGLAAETAVEVAAFGAAPGALHDVGAGVAAFMAEQGWAAMIVRPDFYVYGAAADDQAFADLAATFQADLQRLHLRLPSALSAKDASESLRRLSA